MHIYNQMVNDSCSAIIGFEYLSDLLLAVKEQKNDTIPILLPTLAPPTLINYLRIFLSLCQAIITKLKNDELLT